MLQSSKDFSEKGEKENHKRQTFSLNIVKHGPVHREEYVFLSGMNFQASHKQVRLQHNMNIAPLFSQHQTC